ncbi:hypothetical protein [Megasphaera sp. ASD88]|uniref:hypothetical protein n=1 Tax=Megasphaera sp. ASD88 TaxID=2027407 RepID=UPI00117C6916|nr:hypothetical protein [Megasphaera sp. ASD88]
MADSIQTNDVGCLFCVLFSGNIVHGAEIRCVLRRHEPAGSLSSLRQEIYRYPDDAEILQYSLPAVGVQASSC